MFTASVLCLASRPANAAAACKEIRTDKAIGLANDLVQIEFDKNTGAMVSLRDLSSKDEYLKTTGGDGNPFRAYVDTTEVPKVLKQGAPWPTTPVEDALGGKLVDPRNCALVESSFQHANGRGVLRLVSRSAESKLKFDLAVALPDDDVAVEMSLQVVNADSSNHSAMMAMPYLTGLALGTNRENNLGVNMALGFGQAGAPAWENCGGVYGREWYGQWNAVYDPASGQGLGLILEDKELEGRLFRRFPGGGMSVFDFDKRELKPGQSIIYPTAQLLVHRGNYRFVARRFHLWFGSVVQLRQPPDWLDDVGMFIGPWIPDAQSVVQAKLRPDGPDVFASFLQLPRLYLGDQYDLKEWAMYFQQSVDSPGGHCNGIFDFRPDLGGVGAFRDGSTRVERIGRHVGLYVATQSMRVDSPFFAKIFPGTKPEDWLLMDTPEVKIGDNKDPDGKVWFYCCLRNKPWQDYMATVCKQLVKETGAEYIRLDEAGISFMPCHNPAHRHASPYRCGRELMEFYRKIRLAVDEVNPKCLIYTEGPSELMTILGDGSLAMWNAGSDIAPLRLANPAYQPFCYGLGQIESALQGYVPADRYACSFQGWANGYHEKLWGPGLVARPKSYPKDDKDHGAVLHWHELRRTFRDAVKRCDPTDVDPVGLGQDSHEWSARLWRSDQYWLMVCGNVAGQRPEHAVRVKLPELPEEIQSAFEFDMETLAMRDANLQRTKDGILVTTTAGFSAVLLPKPDCPPLIEVSGLADFKKDEVQEFKVAAFAPWRSEVGMFKVQADVPGLMPLKQDVTLPATIKLIAPAQAQTGQYQFTVTGDCLPLKRWLRLK